jgi:CubicO group peptidase (beta-lactamase class C family)
MPHTDADLLQALEPLRDKHGVPGASVAVLADGVVTAAASGVLNVATGIDATTDSLFQIGSITKVWTTTLAMQLVDDGALELDAPVRAYLPQFRVADAAVSEKVTVRHLMTHSSGIDGDHFVDTGRGDDALDKYVATCADVPQVHPLGAAFSYCNTGFSVLGRIVEVITGDVWDTLLADRIVRPLGLTHTVTLPEDVLRFRAALGHIRPPGSGLIPAPVAMLPRSAGPAGLVSARAADVLGFAQAHLPGETRLLSTGSAAAMQTPQVDVPAGGLGLMGRHWGLGWTVTQWGEHRVLAHDGGTIGQSAFLRVVPDEGIAVALLTNGGDTVALFQSLAGDLLAELGVAMPGPLEAPDEPIAYDAAPYLGVYERTDNRLEIVPSDDGMVGIATVSGPAAAMTPEPFEMPMWALDPQRELFLTRHPAAPDLLLPVAFQRYDDGTNGVHIGGRATPRVS